MGNRIFLGGTWNSSMWRNRMIQYLDQRGLSYYNPIVSEWTQEAQDIELKEREVCDFCLYVITPKMSGVYSIAEVIDDSNKRPKKTVFVILNFDSGLKFTESQWESIISVGKMVRSNGGQVFNSMKDAADWMMVNI